MTAHPAYAAGAAARPAETATEAARDVSEDTVGAADADAETEPAEEYTPAMALGLPVPPAAPAAESHPVSEPAGPERRTGRAETVAEAEPLKPASAVVPAAPAEPAVGEGTKVRAAGATPLVAVYNPEDTEYWAPDREVKSAPILDDPPVRDWVEEKVERPSPLLSVVNGLLAVGSVGAIGYLLYTLGLLPKFF